MSAWVEGLLGAVMGGAKEYGDVLKEEEIAKRKEEEEKRRAEREITIHGMKLDMEAARKKANEDAAREATAKTAPSKAPETGIVGNAIDEYQGEIANTGYTGQTRQATPEEALRWSIGKAREEGREDLAKQREDALYKMLEESRRASKESREQIDFERGPKAKEPTGEVATIQFLARQTYKGPVGEDGKPDPVAYAAHLSKVSESFIEKKTQLRPEREPGAAGEKPPTTADYGKARNSLQRDVERLSSVNKGNKIARDPFLYEAINSVVSRELKNDRNRVFEASLAEEARTEVVAAIERAKSDIKSDLEKTTGNDGKPLSKDQLNKNKATLNNPYSLGRYETENIPKYVRRYLGGGESESKRPGGGKPWERQWGIE